MDCRGRPLLVEEDEFVNTIIHYKNNILDNNNKIAHRNDNVWDQISSDLYKKINQTYKAKSIYVMVCQNKHGVRDIILGYPVSAVDKLTPYDRSDANSDMSSMEVSYDVDNSLETSTKKVDFQFLVTKAELETIIEKKYYSRRTTKGRLKKERLYNVFKPGVYQQFFKKKFLEETSLSCAFMVNHSSVNFKMEGKYEGQCRCGSKLQCSILPLLVSEDFVAHCHLKIGNGECGKYYLRGNEREAIGKELLNGKSVLAKRAEIAKDNDWPSKGELPLLYSSAALHGAKKEQKQKTFLHPDLFHSLMLMKYGGYADSVGDLGFHPFYVHYSTNEQIKAYQSLCQKQKVVVCIDSTGGLVKKIVRNPDILKKHVFLHSITVSSEVAQFTVAHMLSEASHTQALSNWLLMFKRSGAPDPNVCVTDWSRALLNAVSLSYAKIENISKYADAMKTVNQPNVYIRIDVAHTMKKYSNFFGSIRKNIKSLYLASIGQLILADNIIDCEALIMDLFIISLAETSGKKADGSDSLCQKAEENLLIKATEYCIPEELVTFQTLDQDKELMTKASSSNSNHCQDNEWIKWGKALRFQVEQTLEQNDIGRSANPYYNVEFANYFLKDLALIPLWTNICVNDYDCFPKNGTFSTGAIENEHNKLKNLVFKNHELPLRADVFIGKHIDFLRGDTVIRLKSIENHYSCRNEKQKNSSNSALSSSSSVEDDPEDKRIDVLSCEILNNIDLEPKCPTCQAITGKSHRCDLCKCFVHAVDKCSCPYDDDVGITQKRRICLRCFNPDGSTASVMALREYENWGGYGTKNMLVDHKMKKINKPPKPFKRNKKRTSLYLGDNKICVRDRIALKRHMAIPVMKNANNKELSSIKIDGKEFMLSNTCAIDSMFQILLAGSHDDDLLRKNVELLAENNNFFQLISSVRTKGLSAQSYMLRAKVIMTLYKSESFLNIPLLHKINCTENVGNVAKTIFSLCPSYTEKFRCDNATLNKCPLLEVEYAVYTMPTDSLIQSAKANSSILMRYRNQSSNSLKCSSCNGKATLTTVLGDIVVFDVLGNKENQLINLKDLPEFYEIPDDDNFQLKLLGIVHYTNAGTVTTYEHMSYGHYVAIVKRCDKTWWKYDDMAGLTSPISSTTQVQIALAMLYKIKKDTE